MAYNAPTTRSTNDTTTAAIWNADIVANEIAINAGAISVVSQATGDIIVATSSAQLGRVAAVATGSMVVGGGASTAPSYSSTPTVNVVSVTSTVTAGNFAISLVAGETVVARDAVYVEPTLTPGTAGRVYKMDADVLVKSTQAFFVGFVVTGVNSGATASIQISGIVTGFSGLTTGTLYYASGTAGAITATKPWHPVPLGIAISATELLINTGIKRETEQTENVGAVYGYAMGGDSGASVETTDRITFSTSATAASTVSNLSTARFAPVGVSDGSVYGYAMGGFAYTATTDRITFSTSVTAASAVSNLSQARYILAGVSDGSVYGYAMGGFTGAVVATTDRITFSTSVTAASTVSNLSTVRHSPAGVSDGSVYGYAMGGNSGAYVATTDRITFSTSATAASTVSNLSLAREYLTGVSDGSVYGYAMGGHEVGGRVATTDRITFSTSATAASTVSNLSQARY